MNPFIPQFEGELELAHVPDDFVARLRKRVEEGLLFPGIRRRSNYVVRSEGRDEIDFGAGDFLTAYNVGLNDVRVSRVGVSRLRYRVTFWRWTWTAVGHGALLGSIFLLMFFFVESVRREVDAYAHGRLAFFAIGGFFCLLWPWILTAFHRGFAEKALRRILTEAMAGSDHSLAASRTRSALL